jgi:hypothetical protein
MARKASTFPESMGPLFRRGPTPTPKKIRVGLVRGELFIDRNQIQTPGRPRPNPVVTVPVTAENPRGRKCVCRRLVRQRGHRTLRPTLLPDPGC